MPNRGALMSLLSDKAALEGVLEQTPTTQEESVGLSGGASVHEKVDLLLREKEGLPLDASTLSMPEAIIMQFGRPALLIQDGKWEAIDSPEMQKRVEPAKRFLASTIPRVGRIEIVDGQSDYVGTGWMIAEDVVVTNRHVAIEFATRRAGSFPYRTRPDGRMMQSRIDFLREHERTDRRLLQLSEILFIEDDGDVRPDMALMRVVRTDGLPTPIELDDAKPKFRDNVAVIGYPAEDPRNDAFDMRRIFKNVFRVKRLSPGWISGVRQDGAQLMHDCTTLGGNSGSVVLNLATGKACGLHFAGSYLENNYAVTSAAIKQRLSQIMPTLVAVPATHSQVPMNREAPHPAPTAAQLSNREGYKPTFLGDGFEVPLPQIPDDQLENLAHVRGRTDGELQYTHFSIKMRADRRLAFFTAVNIDGNLAHNVRRARDRWFAEPRLEQRDAQIEGELYASNNLDRGHLVRRLDPAWGETRDEALRAIEDSFFFTNCSPQHARLNQRNWLSLEDYVLDNAATQGLKVSVFSGPVFRDSDRRYRSVQLPEEFWKVVVIVNDFTGRLSATGYLLSQADYLSDIEFVYGEFRTYQLPLKEIAEKVNLDFGDLPAHDPLGVVESAMPRRVIRSSDDIVL